MGGTPLHRSRKRKQPKTPKKTAEELATERRQRTLLDDEIEETEDKFKALRRGKLGRQSLLGGAPRNIQQAAGRARAARVGVGSWLGGNTRAAAASVSGGGLSNASTSNTRRVK